MCKNEKTLSNKFIGQGFSMLIKQDQNWAIFNIELMIPPKRLYLPLE